MGYVGQAFTRCTGSLLSLNYEPNLDLLAAPGESHQVYAGVKWGAHTDCVPQSILLLLLTDTLEEASLMSAGLKFI